MKTLGIVILALALVVFAAEAAAQEVLHIDKVHSASIISADKTDLKLGTADATHADAVLFVIDETKEVTIDGSGITVHGGNVAVTGNITLSGTLDTTANSFGFVAAAGANAECTTTCGAGKGCVLGFDAGTNALVACDSALADTCICSAP